MLENFIKELRAVSPPYKQDRSLAGEIADVSDMVDAGIFVGQARAILPSFG